MHPSDEAFMGVSPLMTLIVAFLRHGIDPLQEPRASLSKVKSVQEVQLTRQDFCTAVIFHAEKYTMGPIILC